MRKSSLQEIFSLCFFRGARATRVWEWRPAIDPKSGSKIQPRRARSPRRQDDALPGNFRLTPQVNRFTQSETGCEGGRLPQNPSAAPKEWGHSCPPLLSHRGQECPLSFILERFKKSRNLRESAKSADTSLLNPLYARPLVTWDAVISSCLPKKKKAKAKRYGKAPPIPFAPCRYGNG